MTPEAFAGRVAGMPWVRWASGWQACDCFGLVVLYFREVIGIDLGAVPQTDIAAGFSQARGWAECEPGPGAAFMCWRAGVPHHCGIVLPGDRLLHAEGSPDRGGSTRITRMAAMRRLHRDLRFYRYTATPC